MTDTVLQRAIDIAGGQSALARKIGTRQSLIWHWLTRSKKGVPAEWCLPIERETGVPAAELRPDLFGSSAHSDAAPAPLLNCGKNGAEAAARHVNDSSAGLPAGLVP